MKKMINSIKKPKKNTKKLMTCPQQLNLKNMKKLINNIYNIYKKIKMKNKNNKTIFQMKQQIQ